MDLLRNVLTRLETEGAALGHSNVSNLAMLTEITRIFLALRERPVYCVVGSSLAGLVSSAVRVDSTRELFLPDVRRRAA